MFEEFLVPVEDFLFEEDKPRGHSQWATKDGQICLEKYVSGWKWALRPIFAFQYGCASLKCEQFFSTRKAALHDIKSQLEKHISSKDLSTKIDFSLKQSLHGKSFNIISNSYQKFFEQQGIRLLYLHDDFSVA